LFRLRSCLFLPDLSRCSPVSLVCADRSGAPGFISCWGFFCDLAFFCARAAFCRFPIFFVLAPVRLFVPASILLLRLWFRCSYQIPAGLSFVWRRFILLPVDFLFARQAVGFPFRFLGWSSFPLVALFSASGVESTPRAHRVPSWIPSSLLLIFLLRQPPAPGLVFSAQVCLSLAFRSGSDPCGQAAGEISVLVWVSQHRSALSEFLVFFAVFLWRRSISDPVFGPG
jgi:hypothetical protein